MMWLALLNTAFLVLNVCLFERNSRRARQNNAIGRALTRHIADLDRERVLLRREAARINASASICN